MNDKQSRVIAHRTNVCYNSPHTMRLETIPGLTPVQVKNSPFRYEYAWVQSPLSPEADTPAINNSLDTYSRHINASGEINTIMESFKNLPTHPDQIIHLLCPLH